MVFHELPALLLAAIFIFGAIVTALGLYALGRAFALPRAFEDTRDLAGSVIFRVSSLHGLILALVFAQEFVNYQAIRDGVRREAVALGDIYFDARRYGEGTPEIEAIQQAVADYLRIASGVEWDELGRKEHLDGRGWALREEIYRRVLELEPASLPQETMRAHMVVRAQQLAELRNVRQAAAQQEVSELFWIAALTGFAFVVLPYFIYAPKALNIFLIAVFAGYNGLILMFIFAFSNPFLPPGQLQPTPFVDRLERTIGVEHPPREV